MLMAAGEHCGPGLKDRPPRVPGKGAFPQPGEMGPPSSMAGVCLLEQPRAVALPWTVLFRPSLPALRLPLKGMI